MVKTLDAIYGVKVLNKTQQRSISGRGSGTCAFYIPKGTYGTSTNNITCPCVVWDVSKSTATTAYGDGTGPVTNWCCDSCSSAPWYKINNIGD